MNFVNRISSTARYIKASAVLALCLTSCGGSGSSESGVTFGGAACESGVSFANVSSKGYDELYNYENHLNQSVQVTFDTKNQSSECASIVTAYQVLPWVRIDLQDPLTSQDALKFELVERGGRNAPILSTYTIPDASLESVHGTFTYQTEVQSDLVCQVQYEGAYCPRQATTQPSNETTFIFSANGTVDCTLTSRSTATTTTCHGVLTASDVIMDGAYYGE